MFDAGVEAIFREVPEADRNPGVHIMTGPIYVEGAKPGDILEVRYLSMTPRNRYGSNLAANWGYLYKEFGEKERVTIYQLDKTGNTAQALYAYDFPGKYLVPGTVTRCPECDRQKALEGVRIPVRPHLGTAGVAPDVNGGSAPFRRASMVAISTIGASAQARRCIIRSRWMGPVLHRRSTYLARRRGAVGHGDRGVARRAVPGGAAEGFHLPLAAAGNAGLLDCPRLQRGFEHRHARCLARHADPVERASGPVKERCLFADERGGRLRRYPVVDGRQGIHVRIPRTIFPPDKN